MSNDNNNITSLWEYQLNRRSSTASLLGVPASREAQQSSPQSKVSTNAAQSSGLPWHHTLLGVKRRDAVRTLVDSCRDLKYVFNSPESGANDLDLPRLRRVVREIELVMPQTVLKEVLHLSPAELSSKCEEYAGNNHFNLSFPKGVLYDLLVIYRAATYRLESAAAEAAPAKPHRPQ